MLKKWIERDAVVLEDTSALDLLSFVGLAIIGAGVTAYWSMIAIYQFYTWLYDKLIPDIEPNKEEAE